MIHEQVGDVLGVKSGIIVHGCNCQGVMGSGVALEVKNRYPQAYQVYKRQEHDQGLLLGNISWVEVEPDKYVVNALTQHLYGTANASYSGGRLTSYDAVVECFVKVREMAEELVKTKGSYFPIVFPLLGSVRGGGNWEIVKAIIDQTIPEQFVKVLYRFEP